MTGEGGGAVIFVRYDLIFKKFLSNKKKLLAQPSRIKKKKLREEIKCRRLHFLLGVTCVGGGLNPLSVHFLHHSYYLE